jgi:hypothetical protein
MKQRSFKSNHKAKKTNMDKKIENFLDDLSFNLTHDTILSSQSVSHSRLTRKGKTWTIISQTSQNNKCCMTLYSKLSSRLQAHYRIVALNVYEHICPLWHTTPLIFVLVQMICVNATKLSRNNPWSQKSSTRLLLQRLLGFCFNPLQGLVTVIADQIIQLFSGLFSISFSKGKL